MAQEQIRYDSDNADDLQDLVVQKLPGQTRESLYDESRGRGLSFAAVRIHNIHLSAWRAWGSPKPGKKGKKPSDMELQKHPGPPVRYSAHCRVCSEGLEGVLAPLGKRPPTIEVVKGRRTDRERTAALTRSSGAGPGPDQVLW